MKDKTNLILERLELYKDFDLYYQGLLNDCYNHIEDLQEYIDKLESDKC
jgi:hypothetical protein